MTFSFSNIVSHPAFRHTLIVVGFIALVLIGQKMIKSDAEQLSEDLLKNIASASLGNEPKIPDGFNASVLEKERLLEQIKTIRGRTMHHFGVMKFFYLRYYSAISIIMVLGLIAAISLIFITKDGWDKVNQYIKTVFIITAALTAYLGAFPSVFQQNQNIADNKKLYVQYVALHDEVMSYLSLQQNINGDAKTAPEFIHYIDKQLIQLNTFAIGFDDTKIPNYKGTFDFK